MTAANLDLTIEQGVTYRLRVTLRKDGALYDLSGYAALLQMRARHDSEDVLVELMDGDGITLGGLAGTVLIEMTDEQTAALAWTRAVWDLKLTSPSGEALRLLDGIVRVNPEVSRVDGA